MVLVKKMPNKVQTAWGTVEPVPIPSGSNKSAAAAASASAGPSLFSRLTSSFKNAKAAAVATLRAARGKAPVSEVRESVKSILRIYASSNWVQLAEIGTVSKAVLEKLRAKPEKEKTATDAIYERILNTFGAYMPQILLWIISLPVPDQINLIDRDLSRLTFSFNEAQRNYESIVLAIKSYAHKNELNMKANKTIGELVDAAWFGINQLYIQRADSFRVAQLFLKLHPKNKQAQVAPPNQVSHLTREQKEVLNDLDKALPKYTPEQINQMALGLDANNLPFNMRAPRQGGRKTRRRTRRN